MKKIALTAQKGGTGKTTTSLVLATAAASLGHKVFMLDFDPSAALVTLYDELKEKFPKKINVKAAMASVSDETMIDNVIELIEEAGFDYCIFDFPPQLVTNETRFLKRADLCVVPTFPGRQEIRSNIQTVELLNQMGLPNFLFFSNVPTPKNSRYEVYEACRTTAEKNPDVTLAPIVLGQRTEFQDMFDLGLFPVIDAPKKAAAKESLELWAYTEATLKRLSNSNKTPKGRAA